MKAATQIVQSTFDFAMREINALEQRIIHAEDDADDMLWDQARQVVAQLKAGLSERKLAKQWINTRTAKPYSDSHVHRVAQVLLKRSTDNPRPRFRDAYNEIANPMAVHHSSESVEHYTPPDIVARVLACLKTIDLDPCSSNPPTIPAARHFTENGLKQPWSGRVYMNPPYGAQIEVWIAKLCGCVESGDVSEAIALVPARPDTQWFRRMRNYVCCFVEGRLTFVGNDDPAPFPSAVFYLGEDIGAFYHAFADKGDIWQRIEPGMFAE